MGLRKSKFVSNRNFTERKPNSPLDACLIEYINLTKAVSVEIVMDRTMLIIYLNLLTKS